MMHTTHKKIKNKEDELAKIDSYNLIGRLYVISRSQGAKVFNQSAHKL